MKIAPDRIYLRVAPSGAIMPVIHLKPVDESQIRRCARSRQKSIEYVRADLLDVKTLLEINKHAEQIADTAMRLNKVLGG